MFKCIPPRPTATLKLEWWCREVVWITREERLFVDDGRLSILLVKLESAQSEHLGGWPLCLGVEGRLGRKIQTRRKVVTQETTMNGKTVDGESDQRQEIKWKNSSKTCQHQSLDLGAS